MSTQTELKKEDFDSSFNTIGSKFIVGSNFNSKKTLWGSRLSTTEGKELVKLLQQKNYSFLSSGTPTYWPSDPMKTLDLLDFFVSNSIAQCYMDTETSYDLSSDLSSDLSDRISITATVSTAVKKKTVPKLHNSKTDWNALRDSITANVNLKVRLQNSEELDAVVILSRQFSNQPTPQLNPQNPPIHFYRN